MNRIEVTSRKAELTLGLNKYYSDEKNSLEDVSNVLTFIQKELQESHHIWLSAKVTPCDIVFSGQVENSVTISFINYPKFSIGESEFLKGVEIAAEQLMSMLSQNRIVIEYNDRTIMLEESESLDPKIKY